MKDIIYVLAVAECKSISRAAEILYISQPALSRYIGKYVVRPAAHVSNQCKSGIRPVVGRI